MPVTDRREPGVYVTIEDASYAAPSLEVGRVGYIVTVCDRGPHNRIVKVTSQDEFHKLFGKPNYRRTTLAHYLADKFLQYSGNLLLCRVMPDDATLANCSVKYSSTYTVINKSPNTPGDYTFTANSNQVICQDQASYDAVSIGMWIFAGTDTGVGNDDVDDARQVVSKTSTGGTYKLILDRPYTGVETGPRGYSCSPFMAVALTNKKTEADFDPNDSSTVYYLYANGAGSYYNKIIVRGIRNVQMERMYVDANGNVLYPYLFMDLYVYVENEDGTTTLAEGPWTVSLTKTISTGAVVKDIATGSVLYIVDVINQRSSLLRAKEARKVQSLVATGSITEAEAAYNRLKVMLLFGAKGSHINSEGNVCQDAINFEQGFDGTVNTGRTLPMYNSSGILESDREYLNGLIAQAYNGSLTSVDGSVEQIPEALYPWYEPDYIIAGGYPPAVQAAAMQLAEYRQDCICLADTGGLKFNYQSDIQARLDDVPWNTWTAALYVQYRKIFDKYTGEYIYMTPVYHALERHLYCDGAYFLAEPVAGMEKGAITEPIELAYKANHTQRGDLIDVELNPVIVEPRGKYILTQFTTWKRLSVLKRLHVAKFVAYIRKMIPPLLKDLLQRRATQYWINQAQFRVSDFLSKFLESNIERYSVLKSFQCNVVFDDVRSELNVYIVIVPIRAIERINVFITVQ